MRNIFAALLILMCIGCSNSIDTDKKLKHIQKNDVKILYISEPPLAPSGVIASWVVIDFVNDNKKEEFRILLPYLEHKQAIPKVGMKCNIKYKEDFIDGISSIGDIDFSEKSKIAKSMICEQHEYVPDNF